MIIKPIKQVNLFGLSKYFSELTSLYNDKKLPNKILLTGPKGNGKSTLAYHLINYIFSKKEIDSYNYNENIINTTNRSFTLINNHSHQNFFLVDLMDDKKSIEISQTREMIKYINKSNLNELPKIILIDNAENLNKNSSNSLLKIIEEPNDNVFFVIIHDSNKKISETLKSRCLSFKINLTISETLNVTNKLLNNEILNLINRDLISYYFTPGNYINLINFSNNNNLDLTKYKLKEFLFFLIDEKFYLKNDFIKSYIYIFIELYFLKIFNQSANKSKILNLYTKFIHKINDTLKYNLDHETLFLEFKSKVLHG